jgi:hypothetical protein
MAHSRESLLSTIRSLLEMTEARGCTKPEASAASSKAFELMYKYGISLKDLSTPATPPAASIRQPQTHQYYSDAFVKEVFSARSPRNTATSRFARFVAGYGIAGLAVWVIAAILNPLMRGYNDPAARDYSVSPIPAAQPIQEQDGKKAGTYQGTMGNGQWAKFTLDAKGEIVGTPSFSPTSWPNVPLYRQ